MNQPRDIWEFYALIEEIERRLVESGEQAWADRLRAGVDGGTSSGEILDRVGVELSALLETGVPERAHLQPDIETADKFVRSSLGTG